MAEWKTSKVGEEQDCVAVIAVAKQLAEENGDKPIGSEQVIAAMKQDFPDVPRSLIETHTRICLVKMCKDGLAEQLPRESKYHDVFYSIETETSSTL